jgi:hypothetical protein
MAARLGRIAFGDLVEATGLTRLQVRDGLKTLRGRGLAAMAWRGTWKLTPMGAEAAGKGLVFKSGPTGPRAVADMPHHFRSRLWRALRMMRKATIHALLVPASRPTDGNPYDNAKKYLDALVGAGFAQRMPHKDGHRTIYALVRDSGPLSPQWNKRQQRVFDPNTQEVFDVA